MDENQGLNPKPISKYGWKSGVLVFLPILWGRWSGGHLQEDLAKFGYSWGRKVSFLMVFLIIIYFPTPFLWANFQYLFSTNFVYQFCFSNKIWIQCNWILLIQLLNWNWNWIIVKFLKNLINNLPFFKSIYMFNHFPLHMKKN